MEYFFFYALVVVIIILSGIISGSEAALLSISYTKAKEIENNIPKNKKNQAKALIIIKENIQKYITTIVVLNNIVNIVGSIYLGVLASKIFGEIYLGVISGVLTFLIIMFSEIIPKVYGENHCNKISLIIAKPLIFLTKILSPITSILNYITKIFIKEKNKNSISEGEIKEMALLGEKEGSINTYESAVINNIFKMDDIEVYDIMIPKNEVIIISEDTTYENIIKTTKESGFTRFPISKDEEIIGIINVKDLFRYHLKENKFSIEKILRPIIYAPETMKIFSLQEKLKKEKTHMAIIVNEHGDFTGIITLEDIIEEVLGEIEDEFDKEEKPLIKKISDKKYIIAANMDINDFEEKFNIDLKVETEDFTTINGYIIYKLDKIPKVNNKIKEEKFNLRVIKASKKKVLEVELILKTV